MNKWVSRFIKEVIGEDGAKKYEKVLNVFDLNVPKQKVITITISNRLKVFKISMKEKIFPLIKAAL